MPRDTIRRDARPALAPGPMVRPTSSRFRAMVAFLIVLASTPAFADWPADWVSGRGGAFGTPVPLKAPRTGTGEIPDPLPPAALAQLAEIIEVPVEELGWIGGRRVNDLERHDFVPRHHGMVGLSHPLRAVISSRGELVAVLGIPTEVFPPLADDSAPTWFLDSEDMDRHCAGALRDGQRVLRSRQGWVPVDGRLVAVVEATCTGDELADEELVRIALDGTVVHRHSLVCNLDGECSIHGKAPANWNPIRNDTPILAQPLPHLSVEVSGLGAQTTDANGHLSIDIGGTTRTITATALTGPYASVLDGRGPELVVNSTLVPNTPLDITLNNSPTEDDTAELSAFLHVNRAHDWLAGMPISPPFTDMDFPLSVLVSRPSFGFCNAAFNPNIPQIYFLPEALGSCPNSAFSTIIVHEYAHAAAFQIYGSNTPADLHEGLADSAAILYSGDREIGRGFFGPGNELRDAEPNLVYPVSGNAHTIGLVYAGSIWDLRSLMTLELGIDGATQLVSELWWESLFFVPSALDEQLVTVMLLADDDDGNLANGTPNEDLIKEAFAIHGLRLDPVDLEPIASLSDFPDQTDMDFSWSPGASYTEIRIERNGVEVASLPGTATTWSDANVPPGEYVYAFRAFSGATEAPRTTFFLKQRRFRRGDVNSNGTFNIGDVVTILNHLFIAPNDIDMCPDIADVNDNGLLNIADVIALLSYLFSGGTPPPAPFLFSDDDPTPDLLDCAGEL